MVRISKCFLLIATLATLMGAVYSQQEQPVMTGPNVQWAGSGAPSMQVDPVARVISIQLKVHGDCVTVYSPATNRDYTYIVETPNGKVIAQRPHPDTFQGVFCYNLVGKDKVVRAHVIVGSATFQSFSGETSVLKTGQVIEVILPHTGKMTIEEGKTGTDKAAYDQSMYTEEGYGMYPPLNNCPDCLSTGWLKQDELMAYQPDPDQPDFQPIPVQPRPVVVSKPTTSGECEAALEAERQKVADLNQKVAGLEEELTKCQEANELSKKASTTNQDQAQEPETTEPKATEPKATEVAKEKVKTPKESLYEFFDLFELDHSNDPSMRFEVWMGPKRFRLEGVSQFDPYGGKGDRLSLNRDLDLDDDEVSLTGGGTIYFGNLHIGFDVSDVNFNGRNTIDRDLQIGEIDFGAGSTLDSKFHFTWYRGVIGYTHYLDRHFGIGLDLWGELYTFKTRIESDAGKVISKVNNGFPGLGMHFNWSPNDRWLLTIGGYGVYWEASGYDIWKAQSHAIIRFFPCHYGYLFVRGEWEISDYKIDKGRLDLDYDFYSTWSATAGIGIRM